MHVSLVISPSTLEERIAWTLALILFIILIVVIYAEIMKYVQDRSEKKKLKKISYIQ